MTQENKLIIASIQRLKTNPDYQLLCQKLKTIKKSIDDKVYNESTENDKRPMLISKSNIVQYFIDLPDDILKVFES